MISGALAFAIWVVFRMWVASYLPKDEIIKLRTQNVVIKVSDAGINYSLDENTNWLRIHDLDTIIWEAFIINEDNKFWEHRGLNYNQIRLALSDYLFEGERLRGASTITQQVAKNIFLDQRRSWERKWKEVFIAREMENQLPKDRILEIYLNIAEFGEDIYGLASASEYYFKKSATELTPREAIYLASILPNPKLYNEAFFTNVLTARDSAELRYASMKFLKKRLIGSDRYFQLLAEPLVFRQDSIRMVE